MTIAPSWNRAPYIALLAIPLLPAAAVAQTQPASFTAYHRYDAAGREVGTIMPDPDGPSAPLPFPASRSTFDADGRVTKVETGSLAAWMSEDTLPKDWTNFTVFTSKVMEYDISDRKTKETTYGADGVAVSLTQYSYDPAGRLQCDALRMNPATYTSLPSSACMWTPEGSQGPDRITQYEYDSGGRMTRITKGVWTSLRQDYATFTFTPNGKQKTIKDANGNLTTYSYDGFDRLIALAFPSKTTTGSSAPCTIGTVGEATDGFGAPVTGPSEARTAGDDCEKYAYDRNGNRAKLMKRDGNVIRYAFDALNRPTVKDIPGGTAADVYYGYDLNGLLLHARFVSDNGLGVTNTYDGFGELTSTTNNMGITPLTLNYLYDADGDRIRITHPDGIYFAYEYDGLDRAKTIKANGASTIATIAYDNLGRRSGDTRSGASTTYGYDPASRLASLSNDLTGTAGDVTSTFAYNPASQIVTKTRSNDAYAFTGYVSVSRPYTANGLNQYTAAGSATFTYDDNGNLTGDGTNTYTYDVENRMVSATVAAGTAQLIYDPLGRLWHFVRPAATNGSAWEYLHDGDNIVTRYNAAFTASGVPVLGLHDRFVFGPNPDEPLIWYLTGNISNPIGLQSDHQGSIVSAADPAGNLQGTFGYDEYGIQSSTFPINPPIFGYTSQLYLNGIGLNYYKARIYSPTLGRFMQTDPIGYKDQNNLYTYVGNDPIDGRDPSGKYDCTPTDCSKVGRYVAELKGFISALKGTKNLSSDLKATLAKGQALVQFLGSKNDGNGVKIEGQNVRDPGVAGGTRLNKDGTITISLDFDKIDAAESSGKHVGGATLAHELVHGYEAKYQGNPNSYDDIMRRERNAYSFEFGYQRYFGINDPRTVNEAAIQSCAGVMDSYYTQYGGKVLPGHCQ